MDLSTDASNIPKKVVDTYKTEKFSNEGVQGSTAVNKVSINGKSPITPLPAAFDGFGEEKIEHKNVAIKGATEADGVAADEGKVKDRGLVNKTN